LHRGCKYVNETSVKLRAPARLTCVIGDTLSFAVATTRHK
jgi:hypothetical protein